ncbi:MAG TPA: hypothetical protein DDW95_13200 [Alphaproteobacteria bacterium]|nr:hypothetical protein [Alphaproteobacteria bacterium]
MGDVRNWVENSPYANALGVQLTDLSDSGASFLLPFAESNANPGGALHGGVYASLSVIGGQTLARHVLGPETGPWHTMGFQINYLAAAINEDVHADARLLRRGKELCFVEVTSRTADGKPTGHATVAMRGRMGKPAAEMIKAPGDDGKSDPGPMGKLMSSVNFIAGRGLEVELMADSRARIKMPELEANRDLDGGHHEGAVLALLDTCGAMAAWAETGPGPFKASTAAIQAQVHKGQPTGELVSYAHVVNRDDEIFWSHVDVAERSSGDLVAQGTVFYRIVR